MSENGWNMLKRHLQCGADPKIWDCMIRAWSENDPRMIRATRPTTEIAFRAFRAQHFALNSHSKFHQKILPMPRKVTPDVLHLPRKLSAQLDCNFTKYCTASILTYYSLNLLFFCSTILWLYYSFPLLCFDSTILWLYYSFICDVIRISEVSQLNFLWWYCQYSFATDSTATLCQPK